jgi:L-threonylcarbamoyladenylate synthase
LITLPFRSVEDARLATHAISTHLVRGGVIAYPTETVYGFGCLMTDAGLATLARIKQRDAHKPVLLLAAEPRQLEGLHWNDAATHLAGRFWPGPLTIALQADPTSDRRPVLTDAGTVAVRQTPLPALVALLNALQAPLTSTSANLAGEPPASSAADVQAILNTMAAEDVLILDGGAIPANPPSTVIDCALPVPRLVRAGAIPRELLLDALTSGGFALDG